MFRSIRSFWFSILDRIEQRSKILRAGLAARIKYFFCVRSRSIINGDVERKMMVLDKGRSCLGNTRGTVSERRNSMHAFTNLMHNAMKIIKMNATIAVCTSPSAYVHRRVFYNVRRVHRTRLPQKHYSAWRPIEQLSVSIISFDSRGFVDFAESIGFPRYTRCRCFLENSPARPCTRSRL